MTTMRDVLDALNNLIGAAEGVLRPGASYQKEKAETKLHDAIKEARRVRENLG
jgi:signal transduction histidine kinase